VVVGKGGQYKMQTEKMIHEAGLEKMVIWVNGLTDTNQIQSLYQNARILIYPSLYEGFGLPVAEALLCKTPVITSDRSSLREAGGPDTLYIDPESPVQIAAAIEKILTGTSLQQTMKEAGNQYAKEKFAPELVTKQVINCYKSILNLN
jgi:glycosyltransferase involved in cell wall biosynthesis